LFRSPWPWSSSRCSWETASGKPIHGRRPKSSKDAFRREHLAERRSVTIHQASPTLVCNLRTDAKIADLARSCDDGCQVGYRCNKSNKCCPMKDYICSLPAASGTEGSSMKHYPRYVYQSGLSNCIRFSYFGNGGNFNNFITYNECKEFCMGTPK
ncbi:unnamed protein product, partial [Heligmosomoides polygyrus]|uniref:BPTI/Kunitz inhibitor domain-containing protein n=1 Tax=Heligmosomoides polygyrus TaxID=6339 RepID=A0A183FS32_HELPZ